MSGLVRATRRTIIDIRDYGAKCDGTTDDTAALQAAITANEAPLAIPGLCLISSSLVCNASNLRLWGTRGSGGLHSIGAVGFESRSGFIWGGATWSSGDMDPTTMLVVEPTADNDGPRLVNVEIVGLAFRGASAASRAVVFRSVMGGKVDIFLDHFKGVGFEMGAVADADLGEWADPQGNEIRVTFDQSGATDGVGVLFDWQPNASTANVSLNRVTAIQGRYADSDAVVFGSTDNNVTEHIRVLQSGSAPHGYGLRLKASNSPGGSANSNVFLHVSPGLGGVLSEGTSSGTYPANQNVIHNYDKQGGAVPDPTIETGSSLWWTGNDGAGSHLTREGIRFPATAVPSTDAHTLDDYEEGTWTPTVSFSTPGDLAVTYTTQVGSYTRIGRLVIAHYRVVTSAFTHTTASGIFRILSLPFTPVVATSEYQASAMLMRGYTKAGYTQVAGVTANGDGSVLALAGGSAVASALLGAADVPTGGTVDIAGTIIYTAA